MKKLLLVGGGHGHINVLKKLIKNPIKNPISGVEVTLITDFERQYYSGMLPGFIEGIYSEDEISFHVRALCEAAKVRYIREKVIRVDSERKRVVTTKATYDFDYISMNMGAASREIFEIDSASMSYVKPIAHIVELSRKIDARYEEFKRSPQKRSIRVGIIGTGAAGIEIALALTARYEHLEIELIGRRKEILEKFNEAARARILRVIQGRRITIRSDEEAISIDMDGLKTKEGRSRYDFYIISNGYTGISVEFSGYERTKDNYLLVGDDLRANEYTIAMGDMIQLKREPRVIKAGVFAIRQAPILFDNLMSMLNGEPVRRAYRPAHNYLQIINTGNKTAVLNYGRFALQGRMAWRIKDYIDRAYMNIDSK